MAQEITRIEALKAVVENEGVCAILGDEVVGKLNSMIAQLSKPRKKTETKADKERAELVNAVIEYILANGSSTPRDLMEHVPGLTSVQKANGIVGSAINSGKVKKAYNEKGKVFYMAA